MQFLPSKRLETHNNVAKSPTASTSSPGFHHTQRRYRFSPQDTTVCFQRCQDHKRIPLQACEKHMKSWMFHGGFVLVGKVASMLGSSVGLKICCWMSAVGFQVFADEAGHRSPSDLLIIEDFILRGWCVCVCVGLFRGLILI